MQVDDITTNQRARSHVHGMWSAVAAAWDAHAGYADARGAAAAERLLDLAAPRPGESVLELACGAGGLGIAAASRVGGDGAVVVSDVAPEMTAIAVRRAAEAGLTQVTGKSLDLEAIDEADASYDVVLCREGLMFAFDPAAAASELRRILRPGGRTAVAVWAERGRNPWLGIVFEAVAAQLGRPVPPLDVPGPFSLGDPERLWKLLHDAGFEDVAVEELDVPLRAASIDEWWDRTSALAGPLTQVLAQLPPPAVQQLRDRVADAARPYVTVAGIELPGVTLIASARRAG